MAKTIIHTDKAPPAAGPYSQAIAVGGMVYTAGQIALNPATGKLAGETIQAQTHQVFANLQAVLGAAGASLEGAVKATVYLKDMNDFAAMNAVYAEYFPSNPPSRTTVEVARLPMDVLIEIDLIVALP